MGLREKTATLFSCVFPIKTAKNNANQRRPRGPPGQFVDRSTHRQTPRPTSSHLLQHPPTSATLVAAFYYCSHLCLLVVLSARQSARFFVIAFSRRERTIADDERGRIVSVEGTVELESVEARFPWGREATRTDKDTQTKPRRREERGKEGRKRRQKKRNQANTETESSVEGGGIHSKPRAP